MEEQKKILCVGLVCLDIINVVDKYPEEDTDSRLACGLMLTAHLRSSVIIENFNKDEATNMLNSTIYLTGWIHHPVLNASLFCKNMCHQIPPLLDLCSTARPRLSAEYKQTAEKLFRRRHIFEWLES